MTNNSPLTTHSLQPITHWLSSPTLSKREKIELLTKSLRENPDVVLGFIHNPTDRSLLVTLSDLLESPSVKQIIYVESRSHTEVGIPDYWFSLYEWLYKYYPLGDVAMFGDKESFGRHLNIKLLTFINKLRIGAYLTKSELTIQFILEIFGSEHYLEVLRLIYFNQTLDSDSRPIAGDYYTWEIYYILLKHSIITHNNSSNSIEPQYISTPCAGLVLLAPWFARLFGMVGLLDKDNKYFKSNEAKVRGVFILQRLVSPEQRKWSDSELAFIRILLGLPFSTTLPQELELYKEEIEAIESMLAGVKAYWKVLANTSLAGFQRSFIARSGLIERCENSWLLRVELRSYDMLLDSLPWSYTPIRLPWLKEWIDVIWRETQEFDY